MKKTGMVMLLGLVGSWVLGCAPTSQMVKNEMPLATPTPTLTAVPTAVLTATPVLTETPVPVPTPAHLSRTHQRHLAKLQAAVRPQPKIKTITQPKTAAAPATLSAVVQPATASVANSMATATSAIATATVEAALPAAAVGPVRSGAAPGLMETPTPADFSRAAAPHTPVSIGKLFMGLGLLILLGGILYALRQIQESRRASRHQAAQRAQVEAARAPLPSSLPAAHHPAPVPVSRTSERETAPAPAHHPVPAAEPRSAVAEEAAKPAPRRRKTAAAPKNPKSKKAALRSARPTVKTVRLGKKAKPRASARKRPKTA